MESKAIVELTRYENLVKESIELEQFIDECAHLEETIRKLKDLIFYTHEEEYNLTHHTLEECLNLKHYYCGLGKSEHLMMSGLVTPKEMQDYITRRWNELNANKEHENDEE